VVQISSQYFTHQWLLKRERQPTSDLIYQYNILKANSFCSDFQTQISILLKLILGDLLMSSFRKTLVQYHQSL